MNTNASSYANASDITVRIPTIDTLWATSPSQLDHVQGSEFRDCFELGIDAAVRLTTSHANFEEWAATGEIDDFKSLIAALHDVCRSALTSEFIPVSRPLEQRGRIAFAYHALEALRSLEAKVADYRS